VAGVEADEDENGLTMILVQYIIKSQMRHMAYCNRPIRKPFLGGFCSSVETPVAGATEATKRGFFSREREIK
jgi:hypothetical protein